MTLGQVLNAWLPHQLQNLLHLCGDYRRITPNTTTSCLSLPLPHKSRFNDLVVVGRLLVGFKHSFVPHAVANTNSVLSEQAFKGLSLHQEHQDVYDSPSEAQAETSSHHDNNELDISKLGLPQRLVIPHSSRASLTFSQFKSIFLSFLFDDFICIFFNYYFHSCAFLTPTLLFHFSVLQQTMAIRMLCNFLSYAI